MTREEASRLNGAKSKGPVTAEGKKRSSRNALKHGLASSFILLPQECPDRFRAFCDTYVDVLQPQNEVQRDLTFEAAANMWRIIRTSSAEAALIEIEIERQRADVDAKFAEPTDHIRIALAIESLANNGRALALIQRYESRLSRAKQRALEQLRKLQGEPHPDDSPDNDPPVQNLPNEPTAAPESNTGNLPNEPAAAPDLVPVPAAAPEAESSSCEKPPQTACASATLHMQLHPAKVIPFRPQSAAHGHRHSRAGHW